MTEHPDHADIVDRLARIETRDEERLRVGEAWRNDVNHKLGKLSSDVVHLGTLMARWSTAIEGHLQEENTLLSKLNNRNGSLWRERATGAGGGLSVSAIILAITKALGLW